MQCGDTEHCADCKLPVRRAEYLAVPSGTFCEREPGEIPQKGADGDGGDGCKRHRGADQCHCRATRKGRDQTGCADYPVPGDYTDDYQRSGALHYGFYVYRRGAGGTSAGRPGDDHRGDVEPADSGRQE